MTDANRTRNLVALHSERSPPRIRPTRIGAISVVALFFIPLVLAAGVMATGSAVNAPRTVTTTVASGHHDNFNVTAAAGKAISVKFTVTSGGFVDVFVFTPSQHSDYENPSVMTFGRTAHDESVKSWSGAVSKGTLMYFVVDNEAVTVGGASPTGPVSYTAEFVDGDIDVTNGLLAGIGVIAVIVMLVALRVFIARRRAGRAPPPGAFPPGMAPYAPYGQPGMQPPVYGAPQTPPAYQPQQPPQPYQPPPYQPPPYQPPRQ